MVDNWEIEWNDSMLKHGKEDGTVEFIINKGGNLSDINYVFFGVEDNTWEPLIKAIAERDNSHPDIIRKQPAFSQNFTNDQLMAQGGGQNFSQNLQGIGAGQRLSEAQATGQPYRGQMRDYAVSGQPMMAAGTALRNVASLGGLIKPGVRQRMKDRFATARQLPGAFRDYRRASSERDNQAARRTRLEGALADTEQRRQQAMRRYVPGSQGYDENMLAFEGEQNRRLARDFNIDPMDDEEGNQLTTQQAIDRQIADITAGAKKPMQGRFDRARQMRDRKRAQDAGVAFRPDMMRGAEEEPAVEEEESLEEMQPGTQEQEESALTDTDPGPTGIDLNFGTPPATEEPPAPQAGPPTPVEPEAPAEPAAPTPSKADEAAKLFDKVQENKRKRMAMEGGGGETAMATEADGGQLGRIRDYLTSKEGREKGQYYGQRTIGEKGSQSGLAQRMMDAGFDPADTAMKITQEMLDGFGLNPKSRQGKYFMQTLQADPRFQQAIAAGDTEGAKDIAEEKTKGMKLNFGEPTEQEDDEGGMSEGGAFKMSSDKHQAAWDSLLKGFKIR